MDLAHIWTSHFLGLAVGWCLPLLEIVPCDSSRWPVDNVLAAPIVCLQTGTLRNVNVDFTPFFLSDLAAVQDVQPHALVSQEVACAKQHCCHPCRLFHVSPTRPFQHVNVRVTNCAHHRLTAIFSLPIAVTSINTGYSAQNIDCSSSPQLHHAVFAAANHHLAIWAPINTEHFVCMAWQVHQQLLAAYIPHLQSAVLAATYKKTAV